MRRRRPSRYTMSQDPSDFEDADFNDSEDDSEIQRFENRQDEPFTDADQDKVDNMIDDQIDRLYD